ncbi:MAG TPA: GNAT family N-acetyltransferase [Roseiflexaceae bacterium]
MMNVEPITLEGRWVRLEPLAYHHAAGLAEAARDEEIWRYMPAKLTTIEQIKHWITETLALQATGAVLPFAIVERAEGRAIGSTRYLNIMPRDRGLEIGWTWLGRAAWRTAVNTECKYLLLRHAFETLDCIRVQFKTDQRNERSRRAIERIGGQFEGILRQHMVLPDGSYRDSAFYSIIDAEWPAVKAKLADRLYNET